MDITPQQMETTNKRSTEHSVQWYIVDCIVRQVMSKDGQQFIIRLFECPAGDEHRRASPAPSDLLLRPLLQAEKKEN